MRAKLLHYATIAAFSAFAGSAHAALGDLTGVPFVSYGDGQSYSLPITQLICNETGGSNCDRYSVDSTPGAIKDLIVIATGAEGQPVTTNPVGFDSAFSTPSGVNGERSFVTSPGTSRGEDGTIAFNNVNTWDASLTALNTFLNGENPIFFFNNNQVNSGASTNQELAVWARLWITGPGGALVDLDPSAGVATSLAFTNRTPIIAANNCLGGAGVPSPYAVVPAGGGCPSAVESDNVFEFFDLGAPPVIGTNAATDFVLSGGRVCLSAAFVPVPCDGSGGAVEYDNIDHNLGADHAAYAVIFPELNQTLAALFAGGNLAGYTFHLDFRMGCTLAETDPNCTGRNLNNGYEQLFLGTTSRTITVPEPGTLALLGGVLAILPLVRRLRRERRNAA